MLAPRRVPPCFTTSVLASYSFMKETGPDATPMVERTGSPSGRSRREAEAGAAARLVHEGHGLERVVDAAPAVGQGVFHRQHEARGELAQGTAGIHQRGRVRLEAAVDHQVVELPRDLPHRGLGGAVVGVHVGDGLGHAPEHRLGTLDGLALLVLLQIPLGQHDARVLREFRRRNVLGEDVIEDLGLAGWAGLMDTRHREGLLTCGQQRGKVVQKRCKSGGRPRPPLIYLWKPLGGTTKC